MATAFLVGEELGFVHYGSVVGNDPSGLMGDQNVRVARNFDAFIALVVEAIGVAAL